jgi:hypothetical protein
MVCRRSVVLFVLMACALVVSACSSLSDRQGAARKVAANAGFQAIGYSASYFRLARYSRIRQPGRPVTIYIEGDGRAWLSRNIPETNPTPAKPIVLRLATLDRSDNVVYLARPCQYVELAAERLCTYPYWTHKRFAEEVIASVNEVVGVIAQQAQTTEIHLVGYSGGAAVAALVAGRRSDIVSLRTVAGYLDHVALNRARKFSPLTGSLDPIRVAPRLAGLPQIHYVGRRDKLIPSWVGSNFIRALGSDRCASLQIVDATHHDGWENSWAQLAARLPACQ